MLLALINDPINRVDPNGLFWGWLKGLFKRVVKALVHAVVTAVVTFFTTGSIHAAIGAGIADFLAQLGFPTQGSSGIGRTTPPFNPNAASVLSGGVSGLSKYIIKNFAAGPQVLPCTFNINISGVTGQILDDIKGELKRNFQSGGQRTRERASLSTSRANCLWLYGRLNAKDAKRARKDRREISSVLCGFTFALPFHSMEICSKSWLWCE